MPGMIYPFIEWLTLENVPAVAAALPAAADGCCRSL